MDGVQEREHNECNIKTQNNFPKEWLKKFLYLPEAKIYGISAVFLGVL